ncbi:phosphoesterase [Aliikangiella marina]|uniref:Phosphoesterase n=1 Tax=Aliikangiella marina TaxID=1712262 RepID=A0A545THK4_9GAMM|nr:metallophosphoesterase [Aliikangiella marina]TQV76713.1 phosphoesterase [Aliikangiella marina]
MKIHLLSDLHLEFHDFSYQDIGADVLVLAGDIHTKDRGVRWALNNIINRPVIYVLGNHEYYGKTYPKLLAELKKLTKHTNIHVLENEVLKVGHVNFLGCTLWTDFKLFGDPKIAGYHCQQKMNDYKKIKRLPNYSKLRSIDTAIIHKRSLDWLGKSLERHRGETNVVVTHHAPSIHSVPGDCRGDFTTAAYTSALDDFIKTHSPKFWLHGHLHNTSDYFIGESRILCNPRGYPDEENVQFDPGFCFIA